MQLYRDHALDRAKGLAILAVVLFHITRGYVSADLLTETSALRFADALTYGWHVPTFLLIAGYLAYPRADQGRYQLRRQVSLYYTYLLWSTITILLLLPFADKVNAPLGLTELAKIWYLPIQHFWFLLVLMAGTAVLGLLRSVPLLLAGAVLSWSLDQSTLAATWGPPSLLAGIYFHYIPFMLVGGALAQGGVRLSVNIWAALACAFALAISVWSLLTSGPVPGQVPLAFMLAGSYTAYSAAHYAGRSAILSWTLDRLGRHSLAIYLMHVIAGAGMRIVLARLIPGLPVLLSMMLSLGAALVAPILVELVARRLGIHALLGLEPLPFWREARRAAST